MSDFPCDTSAGQGLPQSKTWAQKRDAIKASGLRELFLIWALWGPRWLDDKGNPKAPGNPKTLRLAKASDPTTGGSLNSCLEQVDKGNAEGVGVLLLGAELGAVLLDLDHVAGTAWWEEAVQYFGATYIEVSPSGSGLRIALKLEGEADQTAWSELLAVMGKPANASSFKLPTQASDGVGVEGWAAGAVRWARISGDVVQGTAGRVSGGCAAGLQWLAGRLAQGRGAGVAGGAGGGAKPAGAGSATATVDPFDVLEAYRGGFERTAAAAAELIRKRLRDEPAGESAEDFRTWQSRDHDVSEIEHYFACELLRRGVADCEGVVQGLTLLRGKARPKWSSHPDYLNMTLHAAAQAVVKQIDAGKFYGRQAADWKGLPKQAANTMPQHLREVLDSTAAAEGTPLSCGRDGWPDATERNILMLLRHDPALSGGQGKPAALGYDTFAGRIVRLGSWEDVERLGEKVPGPITDACRTRLGVYLAAVWRMRRVRADDLGRVLHAAARERPVNPVWDRLQELERAWDGKPRIDTFAVTYLRCRSEGDAYMAAAVRCMFVGAVARAQAEHGHKHDLVICVEGAPGAGKSKAFNIMVKCLGDGLHSDCVKDLSDRRKVSEALRGKLIVEIAELTALQRASSVQALNETLAAEVDSYRPPFARDEETFVRRAVFVATTNESRYLADSTGALHRRWLPLRTEACETDPIDWAALEAVMPQVWGEAVALWRRGATNYISPAAEPEAFREWEAARNRRTARGLLEDELRTLAVQLVAGEVTKLDATGRTVAVQNGAGLQAADVHRLLGYASDRYGQRERTELARALKAAGWSKRTVRGVALWSLSEAAECEARAALSEPQEE